MKSYVLTYFNRKKYIRNLKKQERIEGREEGRTELLERQIMKNLSKGMSEEDLAEILDTDLTIIQEIKGHLSDSKNV